MHPRRVWAVAVVSGLAVLLAGVAIIGFRPPSPPWNERGFAVSLAWEGEPVVGMYFTMVVTVHARSAELTSGPSFLSIEIGGVDILQGDARGNPWDRPAIWNLTGLDLTAGERFAWLTIPTWGAEVGVQAHVWSPRGDVADVGFLDDVHFDPQTVNLLGTAYARWRFDWPLQLTVAADGEFVVNGTLSVRTTVRGVVRGPRTPSLLYLYVAFHGTDYRILSSDPGDDPWGLPNVWNLTGIDTSGGVEFSLDVAPVRQGASVPLAAGVWSPRAGWSSLQFDGTGTLQNLDAVHEWASLTVDFEIA